jgi:hypothetical protein
VAALESLNNKTTETMQVFGLKQLRRMPHMQQCITTPHLLKGFQLTAAFVNLSEIHYSDELSKTPSTIQAAMMHHLGVILPNASYKGW